MTTDQELLSFIKQAVEEKGGVVEQQSDSLLAILPENLARQLDIPEVVRFGDDNIPLIYGSPLVDRVIQLTTQDLPVVYGRLNVPYIKQAGFENLIRQEFSFHRVRVTVKQWDEIQSHYLILYCHYLAMSDQRKEGLVRTVLQEESGAVIAGFPIDLHDFKPEYFQISEVPSHFSFNVSDMMKSAMKAAQDVAQNELDNFYKSIRRHLNRDIKNTRDYYRALKQEMEASLQKTNLSNEQRSERSAKIAELPDEMERKIEDLKQKYQTRVTITGCAAQRFLVPVMRIHVVIQYRKLKCDLHIYYNPLTRQLDPLVCERCKCTIKELYPLEKGQELLVCCEECGVRKTG